MKVDAEFRFTVIEVAYEYAFLKRDNYELNGSIGLHYTDMSASLKAKVEYSQGELSEDISNTASVAAPLPVIGLRGIWDLSHNFWLDATAQFSHSPSTNSTEPAGLPGTGHVAAQEVAGSRVGYNRFSVDVDVKKTVSMVRWTGPTAAR